MTSEPTEATESPKARLKPIEWISAADVEPQEIKWLWFPYVAAGKVTFLEGDPGLGKSWITCAMASAISTGKPLPGQKDRRPPGEVLMMSAEDGMADTIVPRLIALDADRTKIHFPPKQFTLDAVGLYQIRHAMARFHAAIVFVDPIQAYMGSGIDMHKANEVRSVMGPLSELAQDSGCAIVVVRHMRKAAAGKSQGKAIYQGLGSIDFTAAVRSVLQVTESKGGTRFMRHVKTNIGPKGEALSYSLHNNSFRWEGVFEDELVEASSQSFERVAAVRQWLQDFLRDGKKPAVEVVKAAQVQGYNRALLQKAKGTGPKALAQSFKTSDGWFWVLTERVESGVEVPLG